MIRNFGEMMQVGDDKPDLGFHSGGYLFLASTPEQVEILRKIMWRKRHVGPMWFFGIRMNSVKLSHT